MENEIEKKIKKRIGETPNRQSQSRRWQIQRCKRHDQTGNSDIIVIKPFTKMIQERKIYMEDQFPEPEPMIEEDENWIVSGDSNMEDVNYDKDKLYIKPRGKQINRKLFRNFVENMTGEEIIILPQNRFIVKNRNPN